MPYCPNCGKEIGADDKFCEECGTPIAAESAGTQPATTAPVAAPSAPPVYYSSDKKWKIIVGILSPLLLIAAALAIWFGIQSSSTKADYDTLKSEHSSLQNNYASLQNMYDDISADLEDLQGNISELAADVEAYLDVFRFWWCDEGEYTVDMVTLFLAFDDAVSATDDDVLINAYNNMLLCTTHCDEFNYMFERALIEGLAGALEYIGCEEWTWFVEAGSGVF